MKNFVRIMVALMLIIALAVPVICLGAETGDFAIVAAPGEAANSGYDTFAGVLEDYAANGSNYVKLLNDVANLTVTETVYLDLNGHDISGQITFTNDAVLYCMDTQTNDYDAENENGYGVITATVAQPEQLQAVGEGCGVSALEVRDGVVDNDYRAGYVMITEGSEISFHRVDLELTGLAMAPSVTGLRYVSNFSGDQVVARNAKQYGIVVKLYEQPGETEVLNKEFCSWFTDFTAGEGANEASGTYLKNIIKTSNGYLINSYNAELAINGRAYLQLNNDTVVLGGVKDKSLRWAVEAANDALSDDTDAQLRKDAVDMYKNFKKLMDNWDIENIKQAEHEDGPLKILMIGNSHGVDATRLLAEVFKAEDPDREVVIGALYHSGCNLWQHDKYIKNSEAQYVYYKTEPDGDLVNTSVYGGYWYKTNSVEAGDGNITNGVTMDYGLLNEDWDIVTLHQMNVWAGNKDGKTGSNGTYESSQFTTSYLSNIVTHIRKNIPENAKLVWHTVWANPDDRDLVESVNATWISRYDGWYGDENGVGNQQIMYEDMMEATQYWVEGSGYFDGFIPSGTTIQYAHNARIAAGATNKETDNTLYRDYTHLSTYGRLMAAYTWYATLTGKTSINQVNLDKVVSVLVQPNTGSDFVISEDMKTEIIESVNYALKNPFECPEK